MCYLNTYGQRVAHVARVQTHLMSLMVQLNSFCSFRICAGQDAPPCRLTVAIFSVLEVNVDSLAQVYMVRLLGARLNASSCTSARTIVF